MYFMVIYFLVAGWGDSSSGELAERIIQEVAHVTDPEHHHPKHLNLSTQPSDDCNGAIETNHGTYVRVKWYCVKA